MNNKLADTNSGNENCTITMHINIEWPSILKYWFGKARRAQRVERVSIRNIIQRQDDESDWLIAVLVMDNASVDENNPEYLDLTQLRLCLTSSGTFFPWTCSCGAPGCAGMFQGVAVSHTEINTTWLDLDGNRKLEFSTSMLRSAFDDAIINGSRILATEPGLEVTPNQNAVEFQTSNEITKEAFL
ncbi:MAG: hypothetical protein ABIK07_24230 [Planctomycetota bacterium]